jgi:peptidyl-dipeptidase Dcp
MFKRYLFPGLAILGIIAACSPSTTPEPAVSQPDDTENPFFTESTLPYGLPPFDRIEDRHFVPAFERGMAEQTAEIDEITSNYDAATFDNTIVALERSGQLLDRARRVFSALTSAHTNDTLKAIQTEMAPKFAAHSDNVLLNRALFARVASLQEACGTLGLDDEQLRLLDRYYTKFVRAGAKLSDEEQARLREINSELAELKTAFSQNVLNEVNDAAIVVESREELAGLSESAIDGAAAEAAKRELEGQFVITLQNTTQQPPLASLENRELRKRIQEQSAARGSRGNAYDNRDVFTRILRLRAERAAMLGYENHAAYVLADQTAGEVSAVNEMLGKLAPKAVRNAQLEAADLQSLIERTEDKPFALASWDWLYYTEKLRQQKFNIDEEELKPYFEMDRVLRDGVFWFAGELYGLTFEERPDLPVYHETVGVFEVFHDGAPLGLFLFDPYARTSKKGGAWMNSYVSQSRLLDRKPVVANHLNVVKPPQGEPTLLTMDEVNTMFHEFGHAVHGLLSNVTYPYFSGTSVPRDFVEFPSQVHEMWATWPEVLSNYAVHYESGEPLPQELLDKVIESEKFNQGFTTLEYLAASVVDQAWHQLDPADIPPAEAVMEFEQKILAANGLDFEPVPPRYSTPYFSHISGGYSAGYYSYIWSEVLDADTVRWFRESGGMTRANGDHFRETLLSKGGSVDAMELFRAFRGDEPSVEPLLARRGLD